MKDCSYNEHEQKCRYRVARGRPWDRNIPEALHLSYAYDEHPPDCGYALLDSVWSRTFPSTLPFVL